MATMKAIKKRISSVNNTKKIMKAMNLVATSNLQKAKTRLEHVRPLTEDLKGIMDNVKAGMETDDEIAFCEEREVKSIAYIILTSDRGLCGGFNANVSKESLALIESNSGKEESIIAVGKKGLEYFSRRGKNIVHKCPAPSLVTTSGDAEDLGQRATNMFLSGEVDEVYLVYTRFRTVLSHDPCIVRLLPFKADDVDKKADTAGFNTLMSFDPDPATFMENAIPMYLNLTIFGAMVESAVCEYASRMTSMDSATRNATEIIENLTLEYNRVRQSKITQELIEIVTGANAVK